MSKVYLIGAGAGDVELLTLKAKDLIECADVIVYDRLADEKILNFARDDAEKIFVGKSPNHHTLTQEKISQLLVDLTKKYKLIVRLKGGDPFVFGRGGEEAIKLHENKIDFEIVPGITSAISVPAYAGIPVTHRGIATSFAVVTGHEMNEKSSLRFDKLSTAVDTLIFLMSVANLSEITKRLIDNGLNPNTPAAVIQNGTKFNQKTLITTVKNAAEDIERENISSPAIFIVGNVVNLRENLKWFDTKILFGKNILITRARSQASKLSKKLHRLGANCIEVPAIKIVAPSDNFNSLDDSIKNISAYDLIIFTSENGVKKFFERLKLHNLDSRSLHNSKIAAIGSSTADELFNFGICADFIPNEFKAESLIEMLKDKVNGKKILIPRAQVARNILPEQLKNFGADVKVVAAYKTISAIENNFNLDDVDLITFTSSSTVKNLINAVGINSIKNIKIAAIGPITSNTLKDFGITADIVAEKYTIDGLIDSIIKYYEVN